MTPSLRRALTAAALLPIVCMLAVPGTAFAIDPDPGVSEPSAAESVTGSGIGDAVAAAIAAGAADPAQISVEAGVAAEAGDSDGALVSDDLDRLAVTVAHSVAAVEVSALIGDTAAVIDAAAAPGESTAWVAPEQLAELAAVPGVTSVEPALAPLTSGALNADSPVPPPCRRLPVEADGPLQAADAREAYEVDGTGVTVGVISDSFAVSGGAEAWAADVAAGLLPGPGNPCGRETPVEVVVDDRRNNVTDEGRDMAQLVHGVAPGARILFAGSGAFERDMAQRIEQLAAAGADVIVDDLTWLTEGYFQRSEVSVAIERVRAKGVVYLSAAGNGNANDAAGAPVASWQTTAYRSTACPTWVKNDSKGSPLPAEADCLDFDPSPAVAPFERLSTARGSGSAALTVLASVGEPKHGGTTKYEVHFYQGCDTPTPKLLRALPSSAALNTAGKFTHPNLSGSLSVPLGAEICMAMVRTAYEPQTSPAVYLGFVRGGDAIASRQFGGAPVAGATDWVGPSAFGHAGDGTAIVVGAAHVHATDELQEYSSVGPVTRRFDDAPAGVSIPTAALPEPETVVAQRVTAVDGVSTSNFGKFYGTSAAAPLAAGVVALARQHAPAASAAELEAALSSGANTAVVRNSYAGFDDSWVVGAGMVDAVGTLGALPARVLAPKGLHASSADATSLTFGWDRVPQATGLVAELYVGDKTPGKPIATAALDAQARSHSAQGLTSNTTYMLKLIATDARGLTSTATATGVTLAAAPTGLSVSDVTADGFTVSWSVDSAPDRFWVTAEFAGPVAPGAVGEADAAALTNERQGFDPVLYELEAGARSHTFTGLRSGANYTVRVSALNTGWIGNDATATARTLERGAAAQSGLPETGSENPAIVIAAGIALVLLAAVLGAVSLVRRRSGGGAGENSGERGADEGDAGGDASEALETPERE